jgi:hypothetical protein
MYLTGSRLIQFPEHERFRNSLYFVGDGLMRNEQLSSRCLGEWLPLHNYSVPGTLPVNVNDLMPEHIDSQSSLIALCCFLTTTVDIMQHNLSEIKAVCYVR